MSKICLQDYTPSIYYNTSRDFQLIGRLYDVVLNSVKTNADMMYELPSPTAAGSKLIDLLALTFGFKATHNYNINQLIAVCSIMPTIMRNKGTIKAIELAGNALLVSAEGSKSGEMFKCEVSQTGNEIEIFIPECNVDVVLFNDLLNYILPAGCSSKITRAALIESATSTEVNVDTNTIDKYTPRETDVAVVIKSNQPAPKDMPVIGTAPGFMANSIIIGGTLPTASQTATLTDQTEEETENEDRS